MVVFKNKISYFFLSLISPEINFLSNLTGTITVTPIAMFIQTILTSVILFLMYLFISRILGLSALGIWSVVMATTSASRLIDIGFSGGITKFVAKYLEKKDFIKVKK